MKRLVSSRRLIFLLGAGMLIFPAHDSAEENPDFNGELQLQTDRVGQDKEVRTRKKKQKEEETELEKYAPDLFNQETELIIEQKQRENENQYKEMEESLFTGKEISAKDKEQDLFTDQYAPSVFTSGENEEEKDRGKAAAGFLAGGILLLCSLIYMMMKKLLG